MIWENTLPANAILRVSITGGDAYHTQYVTIGLNVQGAANIDLYKGHRPLSMGPFRRPIKFWVEPRSIGGVHNTASRYRAFVVKPGIKWRFECDDGPGGDNDFDDLYFTVELGDDYQGYIREIQGHICGRNNSRTLYYRNVHPSLSLRVHIDEYIEGRPDRFRKTLVLKPSLNPDESQPTVHDQALGCPRPSATFDVVRWEIMDVDVP